MQILNKLGKCRNFMLKFGACICLSLMVFGCLSPDNRKAKLEYKQWVKPYASRPATLPWWGEPQLGLKLVVTTVKGEVAKSVLKKMDFIERASQINALSFY